MCIALEAPRNSFCDRFVLDMKSIVFLIHVKAVPPMSIHLDFVLEKNISNDTLHEVIRRKLNDSYLLKSYCEIT